MWVGNWYHHCWLSGWDRVWWVDVNRLTHSSWGTNHELPHAIKHLKLPLTGRLAFKSRKCCSNRCLCRETEIELVPWGTWLHVLWSQPTGKLSYTSMENIHLHPVCWCSFNFTSSLQNSQYNNLNHFKHFFVCVFIPFFTFLACF